MEDADLTAYVSTVESAFLAHLGRGLMLSGRDLDRVKVWARSGIPAQVVLTAMDRVFRTNPKRPRNMSILVPAVEAAAHIWREHQHSAIRRDVDLPTEQAQAFEALLQRIAEAGRSLPTGPVRESVRELWRAVDGIRAAARRDPDGDPVRELELLKSRATSLLLRAMGPDQSRRIEGEVAVDLAEERSRVSEAVYNRSRQARVWRLVRKKLSLPELALRIGGGW